MLLLKVDKTDIIDAYSKTENDTLLDAKADKTDYYTKTETDSKLDEKADKTELIDAYTNIETDSKLDEKADKTELIDAYTNIETDSKLDEKVDKTELIDSYTKTETNTLLDDKAEKTDIIDAYTKAEDDALLLLKADKTELIDSYTKTETDSKLDLKANIEDIVDSYSKTETDTLLDAKVDKTELDEYVDLTSAQTISGTKQFDIISVATVSKQNKNDASILLAGGEDMIVSSLVTQPQLQEVRDIATSKWKAYVFSTQEELNDWMAIQENVANLAIGDNLYIVDKDVIDYWWDGTDLKILETELPDMSNVITTPGAATGSDNAITDISIDGNTLTPAKNSTIQYSGYDNTSVFLAGGGVSAIADIVSTVDLTDYYNKTKTDELLGDKINSADLDNYYEKHDVDEIIRAVEDQIPPPATISNFVQKTGEQLGQTIQGRLRQQLDERVPFDNMSDNFYITKFDALEGQDRPEQLCQLRY
ncbi:MAG: hypothetical protein EZS28_031435 [Streblomastix strix]|uniref:Uncharacterized protein n=1 Tax=Streblomastix strix TaxID=222440 RepID=A0A5J4URG0_9EUKA|nr:MAG: hypothetical protein EZS28_031435 [Streblomastix strix]